MKFIFITTQFEGFHNYPDAPKEVYYLAHPHRHLFHVKVWIEVKHNDREIEFFIFKNFINKTLKMRDLNNKSCEMISDDLYDDIVWTYPNRVIRIEVSEDNENGSYIEYH